MGKESGNIVGKMFFFCSRVYLRPLGTSFINRIITIHLPHSFRRVVHVVQIHRFVYVAKATAYIWRAGAQQQQDRIKLPAPV